MLKIGICDDEILAIQSLEKQLNSFFRSNNIKYSVYKFLNGESLLSSLTDRKEHFDIIFLDIKMSKMNGMDVAKTIRSSGHDNVFIVFVTALKEYVFEAFDVSAFHYLVKPVEIQKLYAVLEKIISVVIASENKYLILHKGSEMQKVFLGDIMYCEVMNHRVFIYEKEKMYEYGGKINDLEQELDDDFFRCHRSFIVNLKYIHGCNAGVAYMPGGEKIPIATRRQKAFLTALLCYQRNEVR